MNGGGGSFKCQWGGKFESDFSVEVKENVGADGEGGGRTKRKNKRDLPDTEDNECRAEGGECLCRGRERIIVKIHLFSA